MGSRGPETSNRLRNGVPAATWPAGHSRGNAESLRSGVVSPHQSGNRGVHSGNSKSKTPYLSTLWGPLDINLVVLVPLYVVASTRLNGFTYPILSPRC